MFIRDGKRFNIYAPVSFNGARYSNAVDPTIRQLLGVTEIPDPEPPVDYSEETYYRSELDEPPYVIYTKKPDELLATLRWEKIKAYRDNLTDTGGCLVGDKWYHTDPKSKIQFLALVIAGQNIDPNLMWKTMDGSFVNMTPQLVLQVFAAQSVREQQIFAIAEQKRLDDSPIDQGWPAAFTPPEPQPTPDPEPEPDPAP